MASRTQSQNKGRARPKPKPKPKPKPGFQRAAVVRFLEQIYITSPEFLSIDRLCEHEACFKKNGERKVGASRDNLKEACTQLDWVKKRDHFWETAANKALEKQSNKATDIIASQYDFADQLKRMSMQSINETIRNRLVEHLKGKGNTPENFVPLEMHEAMPLLFRAMGVERDLLQMTEADLDADDGTIELPDEDYEAIKELSDGS